MSSIRKSEMYELSGDMGTILAKAGWFLWEGTTPFGKKQAFFCHPGTGRIFEADIRQGEELAALSFINTLKENQ